VPTPCGCSTARQHAAQAQGMADGGESLRVEEVALTGCPAGSRLEVVVEPTGPAWLPIAVFFTRRGHLVYRVSSQKAADLRRFLSRHTKTNGIDADTLARLLLFDPAGLRVLELPGSERAALDRACGPRTGSPKGRLSTSDASRTWCANCCP